MTHPRRDMIPSGARETPVSDIQTFAREEGPPVALSPIWMGTHIYDELVERDLPTQNRIIFTDSIQEK
jgi:hypothetical protein